MAREFGGKPELLAPAGGFDAACAALQYGADAIYLGLARFSARSDAQNFTPERLAAVTAYAHRLQPARRVYVTINTLVRQSELRDAIEALSFAQEAGADAVIVQDLGVLRLLRTRFPNLRAHASTQLAVHNLEGARAAADLGFRRVTLARELGLGEVARIVREAGLEVECFLHGALCYSYSGLCMISAMLMDRSGNRGCCAACCRERFAAAGARGGTAGEDGFYPFSMKDLGLAPCLDRLVATGVASLKIEGRLKAPLYVAAVTAYYRALLDGRLSEGERAEREADLRTIFSRPWTQLHALGPVAASEAIDPLAVGHRGARIGAVDAVRTDGRGQHWLRFATERAIEKHDGLQVDLPTAGRPFGFAVTELRVAGRNASVVQAGAGGRIEVLLPADAPELPIGAPIYCSSSSAVKRGFPVATPRESELHPARPVDIEVELRPDGMRLLASATAAADGGAIRAGQRVDMALTLAQQADRSHASVRKAFERAGRSGWRLRGFRLLDPDGLYAPPSRVNDARRALFDELGRQADSRRAAWVNDAAREWEGEGQTPGGGEPHWVLKVNAESAPVDLASDSEPDEWVVRLGHAPPDEMSASLTRVLDGIPAARLRLALPLITRAVEEENLEAIVRAALAAGCMRWECADIAGRGLLARVGGGRALDMTADWSLYAANRAARAELAGLGFSRAVYSPEDTLENMSRSRACEPPLGEALVWQHTPLFISETPPCAADGSGMPAGAVLVNARGQRFIHMKIDGRSALVRDLPFGAVAPLERLRSIGVRWFRVDASWSPPRPAGELGAVWNAACRK